MPGYPFISSHPLPKLLETDQLLPKNSLWMTGEVRPNVDDGVGCLLAPPFDHTAIDFT